jgi:hypothetical protein
VRAVTLFAQHGYGKADKLNRLGTGGHIGGVVLSPADEGRDTMLQTVRDMRARGVTTLLDPQTYVYSIPDAVARCHDEFGLDFAPITWGSLTAADVERHVEAVIAANDELNTDGPIIAPSPRQVSFADPWTPFALQYARATLTASAGRSVLASVLIEEEGLGDWTAIEQWLDVATTLEVAGFYLVVGRRGDYPVAWDAGLLANLLRLIYRLAVLNAYRVVLGYSDISGLASIAVGAEAIAAGWNYRQRQFVTDRWIPRQGGQQALPRVTSIGLLAPILAVGEGQAASRSPVGDRVMGNPTLQARIASDPGSWSNPEAQIQHLELLSAILRDVEAQGGASLRLDRLGRLVGDARTLMAELTRAGARVAPVHTTSLVAMASAVGTARRLEGL